MSALIKQQEQALSVVKLEQVRQGQFEKEMLGSGKLKARNKADISFPFDEKIINIFVQNGQRVTKGSLLAQLDFFELQTALDKARQQKRQAFLDVQHQVISLGYDIQDSLSVPKEKWELAKQNSAFYTHILEIERLQHQIEEAQIKAPFSGIIANLEAKPHNQSRQYKKLCTLIDERSLEVEFQIMESEYALIQLQQPIHIQTFYDPDKTYKGHISQINPSIDEHGMLKAWATVQNPKRQLLDGMNVKINIKKTIPKKIIIPKTAVINRQNRSVVFTYEEGRAKWNYVELGWENSQFVTVESGLQPGQDIIVSGHFDLAHDVAVVPDSFGLRVD